MEIKGADIIDSALKEFWSKNPGVYGNKMYLLGRRFSQIGAGTLDQDAYIAKWKDYTDPTDVEINEGLKKLHERSIEYEKIGCWWELDQVKLCSQCERNHQECQRNERQKELFVQKEE